VRGSSIECLFHAVTETKTCGRCGIEKPIDEFGFSYPKLGIRHSWCKSCFAEYKRLWYLRNRECHLARVKSSTALTPSKNQLRIWEYFALHPCVDCGETDPVVLRPPQGRTDGRCRYVSVVQLARDPRRNRKVRNPLRKLPHPGERRAIEGSTTESTWCSIRCGEPIRRRKSTSARTAP